MGLLETFLSGNEMIRFSSLLPIYAFLLNDPLVVALFAYGSFVQRHRSTLRSRLWFIFLLDSSQHTRIQNNFFECCFDVTLCEYPIPSGKRPLICFTHT